jgi:FkbM family methyltransferase
MIGTARSALRRFTADGRVRRQNLRYNELTTEIIRRVLATNGSAVDVGCFRGKILADIVRQAPTGAHVACEPNPALAARLRAQFPTVTVHEVALFDEPGTSEFRLLVNLPAQSGLRLRPTDHLTAVRVIEVRVETLDRLLPSDHRVDLIKIDVEGAEVNVLRGARETLRRWKPVIVFEHGVRTSEPYRTTPEMVFDLLAECELRVSLLDDWLGGQPSFTREAFLREKYEIGRHWMFVAHP